MKIQSDYIFYATPIDSADIIEANYKYFKDIDIVSFRKHIKYKLSDWDNNIIG